jgi:hypothetical protein
MLVRFSLITPRAHGVSKNGTPTTSMGIPFFEIPDEYKRYIYMVCKMLYNYTRKIITN